MVVAVVESSSETATAESVAACSSREANHVGLILDAGPASYLPNSFTQKQLTKMRQNILSNSKCPFPVARCPRYVRGVHR